MTGDDPRRRVPRPEVLSTVLPHLGHRRVHEFRWAFAAGLAGLTLLYLAGLIAAAIPAAALLLPVLYLIHVYDAHVHGREPLRVLLPVGGGGIVLGALTALVTNRIVGVLPLLPEAGAGTLLLLTVLLPLVQEVIKPLPALALRPRAALARPIDGLTLGLTAGLGFALAQTLVDLLPLVARLPARIDPEAWIYPLVGRGILLPLLQATCTAAVVCALWRGGGSRTTVLRLGIPVAVAAHVAFSLGTQLLQEHGPGHVAAIVWQGAVVGGIALYLRAALHRTLGAGAAGGEPVAPAPRLSTPVVVALVLGMIALVSAVTSVQAVVRGNSDVTPALQGGLGAPVPGAGSSVVPAPAPAPAPARGAGLPPGAGRVEGGGVSTVLPAGWSVERSPDGGLELRGSHVVLSLTETSAPAGETPTGDQDLDATQRRHPDARICHPPVPVLLDNGPQGTEHALCYSVVPLAGPAVPADELVARGRLPGGQLLTERAIYADDDSGAAFDEMGPVRRDLRWRGGPG